MALGLGRKKFNDGVLNGGITLKKLLKDRAGFPPGYIPAYRELNGEYFINTFGLGRDDNNVPVYYKWLFINPADNSATLDATMEYSKVPESGYLMRVKQRALLPYYENFIIDYYEDINNIQIVSLSEKDKSEFTNKKFNIYRTFHIGDSKVPIELKNEIFSFPEAFFREYIQDAIPDKSFYSGRMHESNNISSAPPLDLSRLGFEPSSNYGGRLPNSAQMQNRINSQLNLGYGTKQPNYNSNLMSTNRPKQIHETGLHYRI